MGGTKGKKNIVTDTIWHPDLSQSSGPKYLALTVALRRAIREGELLPGEKLPPVRDMAWRLGMTPGTVARAYQLATQEGLLSGEVGRGTFVTGVSRQRFTPLIEQPPPKGQVDLRWPALPDVGQIAAFRQSLHRLAEGVGREWLYYPDQPAEAELRLAVLGWLSDRVLGPVAADDIALTHGGQNGILTVLQTGLRGDRPVVMLEDLAYPGLRQAVMQMRGDPVAVEMDAEGMLPESLDLACRRQRAQFVCLTPQAQNPTTVCMSAARRAAIVEVARRHDLQILEDDCYSVADSDLPSFRALAPDRTWYVGSLSKSVSAALRFGWVVCPTGRGDEARTAAKNAFFGLGLPVHLLCLDIMTSGVGERIRQAVRQELEPRLQTVVNALGAFDLSWQPGVSFVWLRLPRGWRATSFTARAEAEGVLVRSADIYALNTGRAPNAVRIAISGQSSRADFDKAIARLTRLLANPPQELSL